MSAPTITAEDPIDEPVDTNSTVITTLAATPFREATTAEALHEALDRVLTRTVMLATGIETAQPRPGQRMLAHAILTSMIGEPANDTWTRGHTAGNAPTGVGKSFAALAAAATIAVLRNERVVLSTEALTLQSQYLNKDAPVVCEAARIEFGRAPKVAPYKGWSNSVCGARAASAASEALGIPTVEHPRELGSLSAALGERIGTVKIPTTPSGRAFRSAAALAAAETTMNIDGRDVRERDGLPLLRWAVDQVKATEDGRDVPGDKQSYEGADPDGYWSLVSTSPDGCPGTERCNFGKSCRPAAAKDKAAEADIIITNHSMIAVQAALGVPVVLGSRKLATFRHVIVDEAHALPSIVRSQGARKVDAWRIQRITKAATSFLDPRAEDPQGKKVIAHNADGLTIADALDTRLAGLATTKGDKSGIAKLGEGDQPLDGLDKLLFAWLKKIKTFFPDEDSLIRLADILAVRRVMNQIDQLTADIKDAAEHAQGVARWVEKAPARAGSKFSAGRWTGATLNTSPIEIGGKLHGNLYTADVLPIDPENFSAYDPEGAKLGWQLPPTQWVDPLNTEEPRHDLSVSMISATLPRGFTYEMGLRTRTCDYPSPFDSAYGKSVLFIPRATTAEDIAALTSRPPRNGKHQLDTQLHTAWAAAIMEQLIVANQGSTLVLAATARAGERYVEHLRAKVGARWTVYSQWDGNATTIADWKADHHSILVGTKSLMTGTDAPGQTNSLVVIDRVPRAAGNPVDDARRDLIAERQGIDTWSADRQVYVSDAAALMEQEAGRLIRSMSDFGMVAVLDPRLLKSGSFSYPEATREIYMEAFKRFERKLADLPKALDYLRESAASSLHLAGV